MKDMAQGKTPTTMFHNKNTMNYSQRKKKPVEGVPFDAPKHGDILPEDDRVPSTSKARRSHVTQGGIELGKNNLNQSRSTENSYRVKTVPASQFYNNHTTPSGSATNSRQFSSTSRPGRKIQLLPSPPVETPAQFRNASTNGMSTRRTAGTKMKGETHEVVISDSEEEVIETQMTPSSKVSLLEMKRPAEANGSLNTMKSKYGYTSDVKAGESSMSGEGIWQSTQLTKLPAERTMHIADNVDDGGGDKDIDRRLVKKSDEVHKSDTSFRPLSKKMTSRFGKGKSNLGNAYPASLPAKKDRSRHLADEARGVKEKARLMLTTVSLLQLAQIQGEFGEPEIVWNDDGDIRLKWIEGGKRMSIEILIKDVEDCLICSHMSHPAILLKVQDKEKYIDALGSQIGSRSMETYYLGKRTSQEIILFFPRKTESLFNFDYWKDLMELLEDRKVPQTEWTFNSLTLAESQCEKLPNLCLKGNPTIDHDASGKVVQKLMARVEKPDRNRKVSTPPLRISQRQMGKGTESEEEDKIIKESLDQAAKEKPYIDPSKVRLHLFDEAGGVKALQADIERLDDQEFLNDTIIELGLKYLLIEIKERDPDLYSQIYVFSSFFYKLLSEGKRDRKMAYEAVKKWTRKFDIFDKKYLVVPINEKMHWYLAILLNPSYAVRNYEARGKDSAKEETMKECIDELATPSPNLVQLEAQEALEVEDSIEQVKDREGDIAMEVEEKEEGELSSDRMEVDAMIDEQGRIFQEDASEEELLKGYDRSLMNIPVTDKRERIMSPANEDDEGDYTVISFNKGTPSRSTPRGSQGLRPGLSDGFTNYDKKRGELKGGGSPATVIIPGESFKDDDVVLESTHRARKRKYDDEEYQEPSKTPSRNASQPNSRAASPMRSRSGMTMTRSASFMREETQQKYQRWLQEEAVVCVFDSLGSKHKAVSNAMKDYIWLEYNDKKGGEMTADDVNLQHIDVSFPTQGNFCDCGLYLLHAFERFFNDPNLMMNEVLARRDGDLHEHWQEKEAAKKREWWKDRITALAEEWESKQETTKRQKKRGKKVKGGETEQESQSETPLEAVEMDRIDSAATTAGSQDTDRSGTATSEESTRVRGTDPVVDIQH